MARAFFLQALCAGLAAAAAFWWGGAAPAAAAAYGGLAALVHSGLLAWRMGRGPIDADPHRQLRGVLGAAVERIVAVSLLLAAGLAALGLPPLALLGGFLAGHLGWVAGSILFMKAR